MLARAHWIIFIAVWSMGDCVNPSIQFVVEENRGLWMTGNETNQVSGLDEFNRTDGVTGDSDLALEVKPGTFAKLYTSSEGECISNIIWCEDSQITFTFWFKVQTWRDSGTQFIIKTSVITTETGFVVLTTGEKPLKVFFNGDGKTYEYLIEREVVEDWTFLAVVIDTNRTSMEVYLNGTQLPDSELQVKDDTRTNRGRFTVIGQSTQTPDFLFAGFKIFYVGLSSAEIQTMFQAVMNGTEHETTEMEDAAADTTTVGTSSTEPDSAVVVPVNWILFLILTILGLFASDELN